MALKYGSPLTVAGIAATFPVVETSNDTNCASSAAFWRSQTQLSAEKSPLVTAMLLMVLNGVAPTASASDAAVIGEPPLIFTYMGVGAAVILNTCQTEP